MKLCVPTLFAILLAHYMSKIDAWVSTSSNSPTSTSMKLLELLLLKQKDEEAPPASLQSEIEPLIQTLVNANVPFDPIECINGPFYVTCYFLGAETPLWERIGFGTTNNIKGQKYTMMMGANINNGDNTFINYAEIFGEALHLRAQGTFAAAAPINDETNSENLLKLIQKLPWVDRQQPLPTCPYDYIANVSQASIHILGITIPIPIQGTGCVRVLYADSNLRIFISPTDTNARDKWESEGLVVVQVRQELILPETNWKLLSTTNNEI